MERAQRKILIQYPKRQTAQGMMQGDSSHLPLKINTAGVIPPIFASSLLLMPLTVAQFSGQRAAGESAWGDTMIAVTRSEEHTSELQSLMRISYAVFCLKKKTYHTPDLYLPLTQ